MTDDSSEELIPLVFLLVSFFTEFASLMLPFFLLLSRQEFQYVQSLEFRLIQL